MLHFGQKSYSKKIWSLKNIPKKKEIKRGDILSYFSCLSPNLIIWILVRVPLKTKATDSIHETFSTDTSWAACHTETTTA